MDIRASLVAEECAGSLRARVQPRDGGAAFAMSAGVGEGEGSSEWAIHGSSIPPEEGVLRGIAQDGVTKSHSKILVALVRILPLLAVSCENQRQEKEKKSSESLQKGLKGLF